MNDRRYVLPAFTRTLIAGALLIGLLYSTNAFAQSKDTLMARPHHTTNWKLERLINTPLQGQTLSGKPELVSAPHGKAVQFNGRDDAVFLDENPLKDLPQFTIEIAIRPDPKGEFEQRYLHIGEVNSDRVLLELRLTKDSQWYLDAYMKSGESFLTMVDTNLVHPAGEWFRIAFVVDNGTMATYVNGKHELDGKIVFSPFKGGQTSIGVRLNKKSWFKGAIDVVRITPKCLTPPEFITP
jgi:hypothetical protein